MTRILARLACFLGLAVFAACAPAEPLVDTERAFILDGTLALRPPFEWRRPRVVGNFETWQVLGESGARIEFVKGIPSGRRLIDAFSGLYGRIDKWYDHFPMFREGLSGLEIHDVYVASFRKIGATGVKTWSLRPWSFGDVQGFRFEVSFDGEDGDKRAGRAISSASERRGAMVRSPVGGPEI